MINNSPSWPVFVQQQRARILRRLERYNNISTAKEQLDELGDLTPYQQYKINTVSRHLIEALKRIGPVAVSVLPGREETIEFRLPAELSAG